MKKNLNSNIKVVKSSIENDINNIFLSMSSDISENLIVKKEKLSQWAACKGIISIYRRADLKREMESNKFGKRFKAKPMTSFAFYPDIYDSNKIGSVAIYGDNASQYCSMLRQSGFLFGYLISDVKTEMGLRLFVDVKIRA